MALRHVDVELQGIHLGHLEHPAIRIWVSGADQLPDLDVATGNGAGERRIDPLKRFHLNQPLDARLGRGVVRLSRLQRADFLIDFLGRYGVFFQHRFPALGGRVCQFHVGFDLLLIRQRLL